VSRSAVFRVKHLSNERPRTIRNQRSPLTTGSARIPVSTGICRHPAEPARTAKSGSEPEGRRFESCPRYYRKASNCQPFSLSEALREAPICPWVPLLGTKSQAICRAKLLSQWVQGLCELASARSAPSAPMDGLATAPRVAGRRPGRASSWPSARHDRRRCFDGIRPCRASLSLRSCSGFAVTSGWLWF
jgi:hypothetical protein